MPLLYAEKRWCAGPPTFVRVRRATLSKSTLATRSGRLSRPMYSFAAGIRRSDRGVPKVVEGLEGGDGGLAFGRVLTSGDHGDDGRLEEEHRREQSKESRDCRRDSFRVLSERVRHVERLSTGSPL